MNVADITAFPQKWLLDIQNTKYKNKEKLKSLRTKKKLNPTNYKKVETIYTKDYFRGNEINKSLKAANLGKITR